MNNRNKDILKLARIQILITFVFIFFKLIRPSVLESTSPEIFKIILLSLPNFFEALIGILVLTAVGLVINEQLNKKFKIRTKYFYVLTVIFAGMYVIPQELNIINIRTNATMDQNDLIFSIIGLIIGYWLIQYINPQFPYREINNK